MNPPTVSSHAQRGEMMKEALASLRQEFFEGVGEVVACRPQKQRCQTHVSAERLFVRIRRVAETACRIAQRRHDDPLRFPDEVEKPTGKKQVQRQKEADADGKGKEVQGRPTDGVPREVDDKLP